MRLKLSRPFGSDVVIVTISFIALTQLLHSREFFGRLRL